MPKPSSRHVSAAGPQSMAEVCTTSGTRRRRVEEGTALTRPFSARPGLPPPGAPEACPQRAAPRSLAPRFDLHLGGSREAVLEGNRRGAVRVDAELDPDATVPRFAGDPTHCRRKAAVLRPGEALEPQARRLP